MEPDLDGDLLEAGLAAMGECVEPETVEVLELDEVRPVAGNEASQRLSGEPGSFFETGATGRRSHTIREITVDIGHQDHRDQIAPLGESIAQPRDNGAGSPGGERREFGGDEDDVHGSIVAESESGGIDRDGSGPMPLAGSIEAR